MMSTFSIFEMFGYNSPRKLLVAKLTCQMHATIIFITIVLTIIIKRRPSLHR